MEHIAIDLGGRESQVCVRSAEGTILEEKRCRTETLGTYLKKRPASLVVMETCTEAFGVADVAKALGHEVRVVPATLVRSLGVGARGVKTDRRDAQALSAASCRMELPGVHVPSKRSRTWKAMYASRDVLVTSRTRLTNRVKAWMRGERLTLRQGRSAPTLPAKVRELVEEVPAHVEQLLVVIEAMNEQIAEMDRELEDLAEKDPVCQRLMSVPGVGPQTSIRFVATLDDVSRFETAHEVQSYLGLTPGEHTTGFRPVRTSLTKAGAPRTRWVLVQAAWCAMRTRRSDPMVQWALEVARRRGRQVATVALARKIAGILFAIWRDGSSYDARKGARVPGEGARAS